MTAVALVHDYLTQRGGAERVVLGMARAFPSATVHTSLYEPAATFPQFGAVSVRPSPLNTVQVLRRHHRLAFPLLAPTFASQTIDANCTVISSSGWAHGVRTTGRKVVYCHAPARWLYQRTRYLRGRGPLARTALSLAYRPLRRWDRDAARSADRYIVNSTAVRDRVRDAYGIDAHVLHPPHSIDATGQQRPVPRVRPGFILCVARLQAYKNVDAVVAAMRMCPDVRLVVVGSGPLLPELEAAAGSNVHFAGEVSDRQLRWLYDNASALIGASYEDFGLTPIEAASFGVPTIARRDGGYLDTVVEGRTGAFFDDLTPAAIADAIGRTLSAHWDHDVVRAHADAFSEPRFIARLRQLVLDPEPTARQPVLAAAGPVERQLAM